MESEAFRLWDDLGKRLDLIADARSAFQATAKVHDDHLARHILKATADLNIALFGILRD